MTWRDVLGHDENRDWFRRVTAAGRLASTFLFVGPAGIGKRTFAIQLAQALLCPTHPESALDACGICPSCQQVRAGSHPDLELVSRPAEKSDIPIELLIGDREHRMQEGLCHNISLKPCYGGRKVAIIDDADYLNPEGANCLLKTLEEPPPRSVIVLIGTSEQRQLPTIRSRSQVVRFRPLSLEHIETLLRQSGVGESDEEVRELSALSGGSLEVARQFAPREVREFRERWYEFLAGMDESPFAFAKDLTTFIDAAGKEAAARRARLKQVAQMAAGLYGGMLALVHGCPQAADPLLERSIRKALAGQGSDVECLTARLDRCLDLEQQIDANANLPTLIEAWLDDLAQCGLLAPR